MQQAFLWRELSTQKNAGRARLTGTCCLCLFHSEHAASFVFSFTFVPIVEVTTTASAATSILVIFAWKKFVPREAERQIKKWNISFVGNRRTPVLVTITVIAQAQEMFIGMFGLLFKRFIKTHLTRQ